jgi:hypothetical protein
VIKNREALASALAVDEVQLILERVRGTGGHAGRVSMWVADADLPTTARTARAGVRRASAVAAPVVPLSAVGQPCGVRAWLVAHSSA